MEFGNRQFSPGLWPSLATLVLLPVLVLLGFWQLDRASQKSELHEQYLGRGKEAPLRTLAANREIDSLYWRKATLAGRFTNRHTFLLDNQVVNRQVGYFVYSVLLLANGKQVLVNRGWIQAELDRRVIPVLETPGDLLSVSGTIKPPPATGLLLVEGTDEQVSPGVYRVQKIDLSEMNKQYGLTLVPFVLRLDADSAAGYVRNWPQPGSGKEKHLGYAFQWFAMATALLLIYIFVNLKRKNDAE